MACLATRSTEDAQALPVVRKSTAQPVRQAEAFPSAVEQATQVELLLSTAASMRTLQSPEPAAHEEPEVAGASSATLVSLPLRPVQPLPCLELEVELG